MHVRVTLVAMALAAISSTAAADKERPLAGFGGLTYRDVAVKHGCVSSVRVVHRTRKVDDPELVTLLTYPRITGLDFDPADPAKQRASTRRFQEWLQRLMAQAKKVSDRQVAIARDASRPAVARVEAVARLVQAQQQLVELLGGIDVPASVREVPDAARAFCDAMDDQVAPLEQQVTESRTYCQRLVADGKVGPGWWTPVCELPAAPPSP